MQKALTGYNPQPQVVPRLLIVKLWAEGEALGGDTKLGHVGPLPAMLGATRQTPKREPKQFLSETLYMSYCSISQHNRFSKEKN